MALGLRDVVEVKEALPEENGRTLSNGVLTGDSSSRSAPQTFRGDPVFTKPIAGHHRSGPRSS